MARNEEFLAQFGANLRKIREEKGLTLEEVEELGISSWQHLQKIETGKKDINLSTLKELADVYQLKLAALFKDL